MSTPSPVVLPAELLARFIRSKHWIRSSTTPPSVKPDAFIPPSDLNLSVTRHVGLSEEALWRIGQEVVREIGQKQVAILAGRADFMVRAVQPPLTVVSHPLPLNRNHAHVVGWPLDKAARKNLAQQLAAAATFVAVQTNNMSPE